MAQSAFPFDRFSCLQCQRPHAFKVCLVIRENAVLPAGVHGIIRGHADQLDPGGVDVGAGAFRVYADNRPRRHFCQGMKPPFAALQGKFTDAPLGHVPDIACRTGETTLFVPECSYRNLDVAPLAICASEPLLQVALTQLAVRQLRIDACVRLQILRRQKLVNTTPHCVSDFLPGQPLPGGIEISPSPFCVGPENHLLNIVYDCSDIVTTLGQFLGHTSSGVYAGRCRE